MKTTIAVCGAAIMLSAFTFRAGAEIIAGPITNPANGHDYYLLSQNSWTMSEAEAESLGGTLAIIKNADEQKWVFSTFGSYGGVNRGGLWIGLHRTRPGGPFVWVTDAKLDYTDWGQGEPNNVGGIENCAHMQNGDSASGAWNDLADNNLLFGVVELPGKASEISLSRQERDLIGNWYEGGQVERACWIAGTDNALFVIPNNKFAARAGLCADGTLFASNFQGGWPMAMRGFGGFGSMPGANPQTGMRGEIIKDKILWSNGTWWSRKPAGYGKNEKFSDKDTDTKSADAQK
jgi:hypothetical protein